MMKRTFPLLALLLAVGLLYPLATDAALSLLQAKSTSAAASTNLGLNVSSTAAGSLLILCNAYYTTANVNSVVDNAGNAWTSTAAFSLGSPTMKAQVWYAPNATAGVTHVTTTWSASTGDSGLYFHEVAGAATSSLVDRIISASGASGTDIKTAATTTANANDYLFGCAEANNGSVTFNATTTWTRQTQQSNGNESGATEDKIVSATGSYTSGFTAGSTSGGWIMQMIAFKAAAAGGGGGGTTAPASFRWTDTDD
jgi:hypothetical protein